MFKKIGTIWKNFVSSSLDEDEMDGNEEEFSDPIKMKDKETLRALRQKLINAIAGNEDTSEIVKNIVEFEGEHFSEKYGVLNVTSLLGKNNQSVKNLHNIVSGLSLIGKYAQHLLNKKEGFKTIHLGNHHVKNKILPFNGNKDILNLLGYTVHKETSLSFPPDQEADPVVISHVIADMLLFKTEMRYYLTGSHSNPRQIDELLPQETLVELNRRENDWPENPAVMSMQSIMLESVAENKDDSRPNTGSSESSSYYSVQSGESNNKDSTEISQKEENLGQISEVTEETNPTLGQNEGKKEKETPMQDYSVLENSFSESSSLKSQLSSCGILCSLCSSSDAQVFCKQCNNKVLCDKCNGVWHSHPTRRNHPTEKISELDPSVSLNMQAAIVESPYGIIAQGENEAALISKKILAAASKSKKESEASDSNEKRDKAFQSKAESEKERGGVGGGGQDKTNNKLKRIDEAREKFRKYEKAFRENYGGVEKQMTEAGEVQAGNMPDFGSIMSGSVRDGGVNENNNFVKNVQQNPNLIMRGGSQEKKFQSQQQQPKSDVPEQYQLKTQQMQQQLPQFLQDDDHGALYPDYPSQHTAAATLPYLLMPQDTFPLHQDRKAPNYQGESTPRMAYSQSHPSFPPQFNYGYPLSGGNVFPQQRYYFQQPPKDQQPLHLNENIPHPYQTTNFQEQGYKASSLEQEHPRQASQSLNPQHHDKDQTYVQFPRFFPQGGVMPPMQYPTMQHPIPQIPQGPMPLKQSQSYPQMQERSPGEIANHNNQFERSFSTQYAGGPTSPAFKLIQRIKREPTAAKQCTVCSFKIREIDDDLKDLQAEIDYLLMDDNVEQRTIDMKMKEKRDMLKINQELKLFLKEICIDKEEDEMKIYYPPHMDVQQTKVIAQKQLTEESVRNAHGNFLAKESGKRSPVIKSGRRSPTKDIGRTTPTKESGKRSPSDFGSRSPVAKDIGRTTPTRESGRRSPGKDVGMTSPGNERRRKSPTEDVERRSPVLEMQRLSVNKGSSKGGKQTEWLTHNIPEEESITDNRSENWSPSIAEFKDSPNTNLKADSLKWYCEHCTFLNKLDSNVCEICSKTTDNSKKKYAKDEEQEVVVGTQALDKKIQRRILDMQEEEEKMMEEKKKAYKEDQERQDKETFKDVNGATAGAFTDMAKQQEPGSSSSSSAGSSTSAKASKKDAIFALKKLEILSTTDNVKSDGGQLIKLMKDADRAGFNVDAIPIALTFHDSQTSDPLQWLKNNWEKNLKKIMKEVTEHGTSRDQNDIGELSMEEAEAACIVCQGNLKDAVGVCVKDREELFQHLNAEGKYPREEILKVMYIQKGDKENSEMELVRYTLQGFLERIWRKEEGEENTLFQAPDKRLGEICISVSNSVVEKENFQKLLLDDDIDKDRRIRMIFVEGRLKSWLRAEWVIEILREEKQNEQVTLGDIVEAVRNCHNRQGAINYIHQECGTCFEDLPMSKIRNLSICQCKLCSDCLVGNFQVVIREKHVSHWICPICSSPDPNNVEVYTDYLQMLQMLLTPVVEPDLMNLFDEKVRDYTLQKDPAFRWCAHCGTGFIGNPRVPAMICHHCGERTCYSCKRKWEPQHEGMTCEQFDQWKIDNDPQNQAVGLAKHLEENGIDCPNCNMRYALAKGGCMHFKCPQCGHEFCSGCSESFNQHGVCKKYKNCKSLGFHCHHPRDCFSFLRDYTVEELQKLLESNKVKFNTQVPEDQEDKKHCPVMEQKEDGKDEQCGKDVQIEMAGLCESHYKEYMTGLINKHALDPVFLMESNKMAVLLHASEIAVPQQDPKEDPKVYKDRLLK